MPAEGFEGPRGHRTALSQERLASGEHVVGQWCRKIMMKRWDPCMGCMAQLEAEYRGPAHHQEGAVDSLLMPFKKSDWASQGPC